MDRRRIGLALAAALLLGVAMSGCGLSAPPRPEPGPETGPEPLRPESCESREARQQPDTEPTHTEPISTKLAYRGEEMADGSVRMVVGDVDEEPEDPDAVRIFDYRAPDWSVECDHVEIVKVSGWWCSTTVEPIDIEGEIVLGDTEPRARIGGDGFATRCHGERPGRLRQVHQLERDSWSGWRAYGEVQHTSWTEAQHQAGEAVWEPCPRGRVGTYNYQLSARIEIEGVEVDYSLATSAPIRTDCGTGIS